MAPLNILGSLFGSDWAQRADEAYQRGELERAARYYSKAGRHEQAARLLTRLGRVEAAVEAFRSGNLHLQAAQLLADQGRHKDALQAFEEAGAHRLAAETALRLDLHHRAALLFEQASMLDRASECYLQAGNLDAALRALDGMLAELEGEGTSIDTAAVERRRNQLLQRKGDLLARIGRPAEGGRVLLRAGLSERAAVLLARAGKIAEAADALHAIGHHGKALELLDQEPAANPEQRARLLGLCGRPTEAAEVWEGLGRTEEAAAAWEEARQWERAARLWASVGEAGHAADLYLRSDRPVDAAEAFSAAGRPRPAAEAFAAAGEHRRSGEAWLEAGEPLEAGRAFLRAGDAAAAREAFQSVGARDARYAEATVALLPLLLEDGLSEGARHRVEMAERSGAWAKLPTTERQYWLGRLEEAEGHVAEAERLYQRVLAERSRYADAGERLQRLRERLEHSATRVALPAEPAVSPDDAVSRDDAEGGAAGAAREAQGRPPLDSGTFVSFVDLGALPWDLGEAETPWWPGTELRSAVNRRSGEPGTLVVAELPPEEAGRERIRRDLRRVTGFRHGSVLELRDVLLTADRAILVYEPFVGITLERRLTRSRMDPLGAMAILSRVAEGLGQVHKLGQAHGWISPRTILVEEADRAILAGLGLAGILGADDPVRQAYQAPELHADVLDLSPAVDLYSLGLLGVELLQAMLPVGRVRDRVDPRTVGWPDEVEEIVPAPVRHELLRCLARDPLERPSIAELRSALGSIGLVPGQLLAGRYEIVGELGKGGMSRVYRARDRDLAEIVAIKTVLTPALGRSEDEDRLLREVQICRRITHPNVVRVHDFGRFSQGIFVIMELLDGPGLDRLIELEAPMSLGRARQILSEIAAALAEAHRLKIVHRDLKPGNVILADGRFKVLDFGIARSTDGTGSQLTRTGEVVGSPLYMAPEQIQGLELTGACDLYALGVIGYTLLTGREPFRGETPTSVVLKHLHEELPDPRQLRPDLPEPWVELLRRLLAKKPGDRHPSAEALGDALREMPVEESGSGGS